MRIRRQQNAEIVGPDGGGGGGGGTGADPTAKVGLTPVAGVADTFIRSDGAPPIDQNILPHWTNPHTWRLETGGNNAIELSNVVSSDISMSFAGADFTQGLYAAWDIWFNATLSTTEPPASGSIGADNLDWTVADRIFFSKLDRDLADQSATLVDIQAGDELQIFDFDTGTLVWIGFATGAPDDLTSYYSVGVVYSSQTAPFTEGLRVALNVQRRSIYGTESYLLSTFGFDRTGNDNRIENTDGNATAMFQISTYYRSTDEGAFGCFRVYGDGTTYVGTTPSVSALVPHDASSGFLYLPAFDIGTGDTPDGTPITLGANIPIITDYINFCMWAYMQGQWIKFASTATADSVDPWHYFRKTNVGTIVSGTVREQFDGYVSLDGIFNPYSIAFTPLHADLTTNNSTLMATGPDQLFSLIELTSNNATPSNRRFSLVSPLSSSDGMPLMLRFHGSNSCQLLASDTNLLLTGNWEPTDGEILMLVWWDAQGKWKELYRVPLPGGGGGFINSTDTFLPYRINSTTFGDSPIFNSTTLGNLIGAEDGPTSGIALNLYGYETDNANFSRLGLSCDTSLGLSIIKPEYIGTGTSNPTDLRVYFDSANSVIDFVGSGSPEGVVVAGVGSTYRQRDASSGSAIWDKETGSGNTGWARLMSGSLVADLVTFETDDQNYTPGDTGYDVVDFAATTGQQFQVTLPSAGTYIITANFNVQVNQVAASGWTMKAKFFDVTAATDIVSSERTLGTGDSGAADSSTFYYPSVVLRSKYVVTGSSTIQVLVQFASTGGSSVMSVLQDAACIDYLQIA